VAPVADVMVVLTYMATGWDPHWETKSGTCRSTSAPRSDSLFGPEGVFLAPQLNRQVGSEVHPEVGRRQACTHGS
jgi:hypothetical protein